MNILHYTLGLPPYRSGGLTKYSLDLMLEQISEGHNLSLLYPSDLTFKYPKMQIINNDNYKGISVFELKNPLIVPLLYGTKNPDKLILGKGYHNEVFQNLLDTINPDVLHIHTLMGLPISFLNLTKKRGIKLIFSTHDYFGLCFKVNFINHMSNLCSGPSPEKCYECNFHSPNELFLRLRNEKFIIKFKSILNKFLSKKITNNFEKSKINLNEKKLIKFHINKKILYEKAIKYYHEIFDLFDVIHFNSTVTKMVFNNNLTNKKSEVIPITHSGIIDNRIKKNYKNKEKLNIGFIGNLSPYKGFPLLKKILLEISQEGYNDWNLDVWGNFNGIDTDLNNIIYHGKYKNDELAKVFKQMDLLIVPSIWKETFSLITLEALSYGIPVLISNNVGAKDLVEIYDKSFIFKTEKDLKNKIISIIKNRNILEKYNSRINELNWTFDLKSHCKEIITKLYLS